MCSPPSSLDGGKKSSVVKTDKLYLAHFLFAQFHFWNQIWYLLIISTYLFLYKRWSCQYLYDGFHYHNTITQHDYSYHMGGCAQLWFCITTGCALFCRYTDYGGEIPPPSHPICNIDTQYIHIVHLPLPFLSNVFASLWQNIILHLQAPKSKYYCSSTLKYFASTATMI